MCPIFFKQALLFFYSLKHHYLKIKNYIHTKVFVASAYLLTKTSKNLHFLMSMYYACLAKVRKRVTYRMFSQLFKKFLAV
jgi:hypothetical protein